MGVQILQSFLFASLIGWLGYEIWKVNQLLNDARLTRALRKTYIVLIVIAIGIYITLFGENFYPEAVFLRWLVIDGSISFLAYLVRGRRQKIKTIPEFESLQLPERHQRIVDKLFNLKTEVETDLIHNSQ